MQHYTIFFSADDALHVSGGFSAHHQELKLYTQNLIYVLTYTRCCEYSLSSNLLQSYFSYNVQARNWLTWWLRVHLQSTQSEDSICPLSGVKIYLPKQLSSWHGFWIDSVLLQRFTHFCQRLKHNYNIINKKKNLLLCLPKQHHHHHHHHHHQ
jgi:hypothetical protein